MVKMRAITPICLFCIVLTTLAQDYRIQRPPADNRMRVADGRIAMMDSNTAFLAHFDGTVALSNSNYTAETGQIVTFYGNSFLDPDLYKYGPGAYSGPVGAGDYATIPVSTEFDFGTDNFTIDLMVHPSTGDGGVFQFSPDGVSRIDLAVYISKFYADVVTNGVVFSGSFGDTIAINTWYHIAVVRNGNTLTWYVDGASKLTNDVTGKNFDLSGNNSFIGTYSDSSYGLYGLIDEFRISKGIARWTANFTPPTAPY